MPFGLTSAPEEFQRRQHHIIEGLPGIYAIHDDILVIGNGATQEEPEQDHDEKIHALMHRCREKNTRLNANKIKLKCNEVTFMGHVLTDAGLKSDPEMIRAILEMPKPSDVAGVRRLVGFINYLQRFLPNLSEVCESLRKLTHKDIPWQWNEEQQLAFDTMKQLVRQTTVLKYYEPSQELTLQCDASDKGLVSLPLSAARLDDVLANVDSDQEMQELKTVILNGWPERKSGLPRGATEHYSVCEELTVQDGLIFRGERVVVPRGVRKQMVQQIHSTHIGAEGCLRRARESMH